MTDTPITSNSLYNALFGTSPSPVPNAIDIGTKTIKRKIEHTVISGEDSDDSVYVSQIFHDEYLVGIQLVTDGMGASGGVGGTIAVTATDEDGTPTTTTVAAAASVDLTGEGITALAFAGMYYTPAVGKARVALVHAGANPIVGKKIKGWIEVMRASA